ncbi:MAG: hypothetical protein Dasosvirus3_1, partial [Dasosvirus sp.]
MIQPVQSNYSKKYKQLSKYKCQEFHKSIENIQQLLELIKIPNAINILRSQYCVLPYYSKKSPDLVLLKAINRTDLSKNVCQNIIIDTKTESLVAYPLDKLIDISDQNIFDRDIQQIFDKIDGIFCFLYWYQNKWNLGTDSNPDGDTIIGFQKQTKQNRGEVALDQLFWEVFQEKDYSTEHLDTKYTYVFELVVHNYVKIIPYIDNNLYLIAVRNMNTIKELNIMSREFDCFARPKIYRSLEEFKQIDQNTHEGCVIVTNNFDRFKIKTVEFIKKVYIFPSLRTAKRDVNINLHLLKVIQESKVSELSRYCPEYRDPIQMIRNSIDLFINNIKDIYDKIIEEKIDRKTFTSLIQKYN